MNLEQMRAQRNALADKMKALSDLEAGGTELTEAQTAEFEAASAEFDKLDATIKRAEKSLGVQARLDQPRPSPGAQQVAAAQEGPHYPGGPETPRQFETFGEQIAAVYRARNGAGVDPRLDYQDFSKLRAGTQNMGTGTAGGFMVQENFRASLLQVDPAQNILLGRVLELPPGEQPDAPTSQPALDQGSNQQGGVTVSRVGEAVAAPETDAKLRKVTWTPKELTAHIPITNQLMRNWSGAETTAEMLLRQALNAKREQEAYSGNGATQMLGVTKAGCACKINRTTADTVVFADIANMVGRFLQRGGGGYWVYNQLLLPALIQMKDGNNNPVWQPSIREGSPATLWGLPAFPYEFSAAVGALGDLCLLNTNPYYVVQRGSGPFIDVGYINTDFTQRQQRLMISMFDDGAPWLTAPFKLVNGAEVSPFVLLDVPSS